MLYMEKDFQVTVPDKVEKENSLQNQLVAISRTFIKKFTSWTPEQKSLFCMCLTKIRWTEVGNSNVVELENSEVMDALKLNYDANHQSTYLRKAFKQLAKNSWIEWTDKSDPERYNDGFIITNIKSIRGKKVVTFNPEYMPMLENFLERNFITVWTTDAYSFKNAAAWNLFIDLRTHCNTQATNRRTYTTEQLKEVLGVDPKSYIRKSDGAFNRSDFEKYSLDKAISEINAGQMMQILPTTGSKGKFYKKEYEYGYVSGYTFKYIVRTQQKPSDEVIEGMKEDYQMEQMSLYDYPEMQP